MTGLLPLEPFVTRALHGLDPGALTTWLHHACAGHDLYKHTTQETAISKGELPPAVFVAPRGVARIDLILDDGAVQWNLENKLRAATNIDSNDEDQFARYRAAADANANANANANALMVLLDMNDRDDFADGYITIGYLLLARIIAAEPAADDYAIAVAALLFAAVSVGAYRGHVPDADLATAEARSCLRKLDSAVIERALIAAAGAYPLSMRRWECIRDGFVRDLATRLMSQGFDVTVEYEPNWLYRWAIYDTAGHAVWLEGANGDRLTGYLYAPDDLPGERSGRRAGAAELARPSGPEAQIIPVTDGVGERLGDGVCAAAAFIYLVPDPGEDVTETVRRTAAQLAAALLNAA